jgi:hypothetical protein
VNKEFKKEGFITTDTQDIIPSLEAQNYLETKKKEKIGETTSPPNIEEEGSRINSEVQNAVQDFREKTEGSKQNDKTKTVGKLEKPKKVVQGNKNNQIKKVNHSQRSGKREVQNDSSNFNQQDSLSENNQLNQFNQLIDRIQYLNDYFESQIKVTFIRRVESKYYIRWLHNDQEEEEKINYIHKRLEIYNQLLELRMILHRSNYDVLRMCKTWTI